MTEDIFTGFLFCFVLFCFVLFFVFFSFLLFFPTTKHYSPSQLNTRRVYLLRSVSDLLEAKTMILVCVKERFLRAQKKKCFFDGRTAANSLILSHILATLTTMTLLFVNAAMESITVKRERTVLAKSKALIEHSLHRHQIYVDCFSSNHN